MSRLLRMLRRGVLGLVVTVLAGCHFQVLDPAGPVSDAQRTILFNALAIMLCIVVPVMLATLIFPWWFRPGNAHAVRLPKWSFSGRIEIVTWSVPLMTIIFLGGIAWIGSHQLDPAKPLSDDQQPLDVQVVSLDWKWLFIYPEQKIASLNQLVVPVGRPLRFHLTSASVWDAFFVPQLGSMIYTMRGMATTLNLKAARAGTFYSMSSHLSGDGFANMTFETKAIPESDFTDWVSQAQSSSATLDDDGYKKLLRQTLKNPQMTYRLAADSLFDRIVDQSLPPGEGPKSGRPNPSVSPVTPQAEQGT